MMTAYLGHAFVRAEPQR